MEFANKATPIDCSLFSRARKVKEFAKAEINEREATRTQKNR
jgi:hypothetical protein